MNAFNKNTRAKAKTTTAIEHRAYGFSILPGIVFDVLLIPDSSLSVCYGLPGISLIWNDEFEVQENPEKI